MSWFKQESNGANMLNRGDFDVNYGYVMLYDIFESNHSALDFFFGWA